MGRFRSRPTAVLLTLTLIGGALTFAPAPRADAVVPGVNGRIAFHSVRDGDGEILVMNADGTRQTPLTDNTADDRFPAWSPDGSRIAFTSDRDGDNEIYVMNADGTGQTNLTNNTADDYSPAWSPDGTKIAFDSDRVSLGDIYVMNADGTGQTNITTNTAYDSDPAWSPDGARIAFASDRAGDQDIWVMNLDGTPPDLLTTDVNSDNAPEWSADGTKITFSSDRTGNADVWVMDADGTDETNLTNNPGTDYLSAWSPDGTKITFTTERDGPIEVYVMSPSGAGPTNLTNNATTDTNPDWGVPCDHSFGDVPNWVDRAVDWASCNRHMSGYPGNRFKPDNNMTRAQVARLLYRIAGSPDTLGQNHDLTDVPNWVEDAVTWLVANNHATGYDDKTFRPDNPISRAEYTRMQYRINGTPGSPAHPFTDVPNWVTTAVNWIADPANTPPYATGYPGDLYKPDNDITRAEATRMTCRILGTATC